MKHLEPLPDIETVEVTWEAADGTPQTITTTPHRAQEAAELLEDAADARAMGGKLPTAVNEIEGVYVVAVDNQLMAVHAPDARDVAEKLREVSA